ncbi:hypothetical protein [Bacillus pinisoli]|uniref:hypothetical protein n=1 Tax=Bacillus pinisoli TaxID=2901866 RepID=UPI001FF17FF5|nr:hypothetical protein [Bacillus pinisoli]
MELLNWFLSLNTLSIIIVVILAIWIVVRKITKIIGSFVSKVTSLLFGLIGVAKLYFMLF